MLLDQEELQQKDLLEEKTIDKLKTITALWFILGILGVILCVLFFYLEYKQPFSSQINKRWFFRMIFLIVTCIFTSLAYKGISYRMQLNKNLSKDFLIKIPNYEVYFWIMVTSLSCFFWYCVENNVF